MSRWSDNFERCPQCLGAGQVARDHFVYIIFAADGTCLYVGRTTHPGQFGMRWRQHQIVRPQMTDQATRCLMKGPYAFKSASRIEVEQQVLLKPLFSPIRATRQAALAAKRLGVEVTA